MQTGTPPPCAHLAACPTCRRTVTASIARKVADHRLTARQLQVLQEIADGHTVAVAASRLGISVQTAKSHLGRIYSVLDVSGQAGAVAVALRAGVIE